MTRPHRSGAAREVVTVTQAPSMPAARRFANPKHMLRNRKKLAKMSKGLYTQRMVIGESSKGKTRDCHSRDAGSSPASPAATVFRKGQRVTDCAGEHATFVRYASQTANFLSGEPLAVVRYTGDPAEYMCPLEGLTPRRQA